METQQQPQQAVNPQQPQYNAQPVIQPQKKRSTGKVIAIGCGVLALCSVVCGVLFFVGGAAVVGVSLDVVKEQVTQNICDVSDARIQTVYQNNTTQSFRNTTTLEEFRADIQQVDDSVCTDIENAGFWDIVSQGWSLNYENLNGNETLDFSATIDGKVIILQMETVNGELKIDEFAVN